MDRNKLRRKVEQQTVRDHTNMRHWADRKLRRYDKTMNEPILPTLCTITFISMLVSAFATSFFDLYSYYAFETGRTLLRTLTNAASSAFISWLVFSAMLIPAATIQLKRGFDDPYFKKFLYTRRGKPRMPLRLRFKIYQLTAIIGLVLLFAAYVTLLALN